MAARSTRRKIRDHGDKILQDLFRVTEHLKLMDDLAEGKSTYINANMVRIVLMLEGVFEVMENFIDGL